MNRKRVLVAFGDILGFRSWIKRGLTTPEESRKLINEFYGELEEYALNTQNYVKFLGDGFLSVKELDDKNKAEDAIVFLQDLYELDTKIKWILRAHFPRPQGFRIRVGMGFVWKRYVRKMAGEEEIRWPEYIGYTMNMVHSLLEISQDQCCVCHESIIEFIGDDQENITFTRLDGPLERPRGVDQEDLQGLWVFGVTSKDKKGH